MNSLGHFLLIHEDRGGGENCLENACNVMESGSSVLAIGSTEWVPHLPLYNLAEVWH